MEYEDLKQQYIRAMGGPEAYNRFITRINPNAPEFSPKADTPFEWIANCYDYAMNDLDFVGSRSYPGQNKNIPLFDGTFSHDGKNDPALFKQYIGATIRGIQADGAVFISPDRLQHWSEHELKNSHYLIAAYAKNPYEDPKNAQYIQSGDSAGMLFDFHFARQNKHGGFSQKWGNYTPSNLDAAGKPFSDPLTANEDGYRFIGFFAVPQQGLDVGLGPNHQCNTAVSPENRRTLDSQQLPVDQIRSPYVAPLKIRTNNTAYALAWDEMRAAGLERFVTESERKAIDLILRQDLNIDNIIGDSSKRYHAQETIKKAAHDSNNPQQGAYKWALALLKRAEDIESTRKYTNNESITAIQGPQGLLAYVNGASDPKTVPQCVPDARTAQSSRGRGK